MISSVNRFFLEPFILVKLTLVKGKNLLKNGITRINRLVCTNFISSNLSLSCFLYRVDDKLDIRSDSIIYIVPFASLIQTPFFFCHLESDGKYWKKKRVWLWRLN